MIAGAGDTPHSMLQVTSRKRESALVTRAIVNGSRMDRDVL